MMKRKSKEVLKKGIGLISLTGAASLNYLLLSQYLQKDFTSIEFLIWIIVFLLAITQLVGSAVFLYKGGKLGINILIICYLIELFGFAVGKFAYLVTTGPVVSLKYDGALNKESLEFNLFQVAYVVNLSGGYSFFSVNIFSLGILILLVSLAQDYK